MDIKKVIIKNKTIIPLVKQYDIKIYNQLDLLPMGMANDLIKKECIAKISSKRSSYIQQDKKKHKYDKVRVISINDIVALLAQSNLKCAYCNCCMLLIYKNVRQRDQWTLDRIDNLYGHNTMNVVVCCLDCNLKRRCLSKDKFHQSKQINIINKCV
jgi:hypothetical protein